MRELVVKFRAVSGDLAKGFADAGRATTRFRGTVEAEGAKTSRAWQLFTAGARKIGSAVKAAAATAGVGIAAVLSVSIAKGFARLSTIDQATAKLRGLGKSGTDIAKIMKAATASVKGTAFGLGDAATVAAGAVAAGIKPGKQLQTTLNTVANTAAAAGVDLTDMGAIFNKVAGNGKAGNDALQQLADRGIPIYAALAKQLHMTQADVFDLAKKGGISFAQFQKAAQTASGGVAKAMGQTVSGAFSNVQAALGRLGAGALAGIFPKLAPALNALIPIIDKVTAAITPMATQIGARLGTALQGAVTWLGQLVDRLDFSSVGAFVKSLQIPPAVSSAWSVVSGWVRSLIAQGPALKAGLLSAWQAVSPVLRAVGGQFALLGAAVKTQLLPTWQALQPVLQAVAARLPEIGAQLRGAGEKGLSVLNTGLKFLGDHMDTVLKVLPAVIGAFVLWRGTMKAAAGAEDMARASVALMTPVTLANTVASLANNVARVIAIRLEREHAIAMGERVGVLAASSLGTLRNTAALIASKVAMVAVSVATKAWAAAQWLINAAMSANPIGIVIVAIAALVAGIILAWKHSETFRKVVLAVWGAIKVAVAAVVGWFTSKVVPFFAKTLPAAIGVVVSWVKAHWPLLLSILTGPIGAAVIFIVRHWDQIRSATTAAWNAVKSAVSGAWTAIVSGIRSKITSAVNAVKGIRAKVLSVLAGIGAALRNAGAGLIQKVIDGIVSKIDAVGDAARRIAERVKGFFGGSPVEEGPLLGWNGGHVGQNLVQMGLIDGLAATTSRLVAGARQLAGKVAGAFGGGRTAPRPPAGGGGILPPGPSLIAGQVGIGSGPSGDQWEQLLAAVEGGKNLQVFVVLDKGAIKDLARGEAEVVLRDLAGARK